MNVRGEVSAPMSKSRGSEELAVLIHLEDELRDKGCSVARADAAPGSPPTVSIDVLSILTILPP